MLLEIPRDRWNAPERHDLSRIAPNNSLSNTPSLKRCSTTLSPLEKNSKKLKKVLDFSL